MEREANYLLVGASCLVLLFAVTVCVLWLSNAQLSSSRDTYDVLFTGPVQGLVAGSDVRFNGVKIGEVESLSIDRANTNQVIVKTHVTSDAPIKQDSYAMLEPQGLTGDSYVQITAGSPSAGLLKTATRPGQVPTVLSRRTGSGNLMSDSDVAVTQASEVLTRANRVLSDRNIGSIDQTLTDVRAVADEMSAHRTVFADVQKTVRDADSAILQAQVIERSGQTLLDGDGKRAVKNLADATEQAKAGVQELRGLMSKLQGPTVNFATNGLPQITATAIELQNTSRTLNRFIKEIQANPREFLNKPMRPELEVKP